MNVLFVGRSKGSWRVRGKQIAKALGARATSAPKPEDWRWADVVVLVKHAIESWGLRAQETGLPVIWDVLDIWPQPDENQRPIRELAGEILRTRATFGITAVIGATRAMASAIGGIYIPHHARPGLVATPIRPRAKVVAYEGTPKYLGSWCEAVASACQARGLEFAINPTSLTAADVVVALRGEHWDGEVCREWKSGVKYVNALTAARPVITQQTAAFEEIAPIGLVVSNQQDLDAAIDAACIPEFRYRAVLMAEDRAPEFHLSTIAGQYQVLLRSVMQEAA